MTLWHGCFPVNLLHIFRTQLSFSEPYSEPSRRSSMMELFELFSKKFHHRCSTLMIRLWIYTCLQPCRYHTWKLWYLPPAIILKKKNTKFERIHICNCPFVIEKQPFKRMDGCNWSGKIYSKPLKEWMSATGPWEKT